MSSTNVDRKRAILPPMPKIDCIREALCEVRPQVRSVRDKKHACVAAVLRSGIKDPNIPEILIIRRTEREGDPWSGHMAFPGGRYERGDPSPRFTAERETREEVGLDLETAEYLGRLDDMAAKGSPLVISGFVYHVERDHSQLTLERSEVCESFWVSLSDLVDPQAHVRYGYEPAGPDWHFPGIALADMDDEDVIWGLTYAFLEQILSFTDKELPSSQPWFRSLRVGEWDKWENREQVAAELVKRIEQIEKVKDGKGGDQ